MTKMRLIGLDPGGTTGVAAVTFDTVNKGLENYHWWFHQLAGEAHHLDLWNLLGQEYTAYSVHYDFRIITESFEYRGRDIPNIDLRSREYIGVTRLFGQQCDIPVVLQTAGLAKGFIPDKAKNGLEANAKLKVLDLYKPGLKHANDATRHLITYMVKRLKRYDLIEKWKELV